MPSGWSLTRLHQIRENRVPGWWPRILSHAASAATGESGLCYRTAIYHDTGDITWLFPHSNTAELISAWLDLAAELGDPYYEKLAVAYADRLLSDPIKGFYRGERKEAHGLAWYWPDDGTYTGGYSMRFPHALRRLNAATGNPRYLEACQEIGETLLGRTLPSGLSSMVGWCPQRGWIGGNVAGSRYVYVISTYANLFAITQEQKYADAYEKALDALLRMQRADGAFYQTYHLDSLEPADASVKLHFFAYILNSLAEAHSLLHDDRLVACALRITRYLADVFYYRLQIPYCENPGFETDLLEADSAISDCNHGLFWLHSVTGNEVCQDVALKLWMQTWLSQWKCASMPGWDGALPKGVKPGLETQQSAKTIAARHLQYEESRIARCEVWFVTQHIQASRRLLSLMRGNAFTRKEQRCHHRRTAAQPRKNPWF